MRNRKMTVAAAAAAALILATLFLAWQSPGTSASAQVMTPTTFEIIHFAEKRGRITDTQYSFDTTIYAHYVGSTKMTVELYLYNKSTGLPVPGRCAQLGGCRFTFAPGSAARQNIHFEDLIDFAAAGNVVIGSALLVVRDDDSSKLLTDIYMVNSHTSAFDLTYMLLPLHRLPNGWRAS